MLVFYIYTCMTRQVESCQEGVALVVAGQGRDVAVMALKHNFTTSATSFIMVRQWGETLVESISKVLKIAYIFLIKNILKCRKLGVAISEARIPTVFLLFVENP